MTSILPILTVTASSDNLLDKLREFINLVNNERNHKKILVKNYQMIEPLVFVKYEKWEDWENYWQSCKKLQKIEDIEKIYAVFHDKNCRQLYREMIEDLQFSLTKTKNEKYFLKNNQDSLVKLTSNFKKYATIKAQQTKWKRKIITDKSLKTVLTQLAKQVDSIDKDKIQNLLFSNNEIQTLLEIFINKGEVYIPEDDAINSSAVFDANNNNYQELTVPTFSELMDMVNFHDFINKIRPNEDQLKDLHDSSNFYLSLKQNRENWVNNGLDEFAGESSEMKDLNGSYSGKKIGRGTADNDKGQKKTSEYDYENYDIYDY